MTVTCLAFSGLDRDKGDGAVSVDVVDVKP